DTITAPTELAAFTLIGEGKLAFPQPAGHPRYRVCALGTGVIVLAMPITGRISGTGDAPRIHLDMLLAQGHLDAADLLRSQVEHLGSDSRYSGEKHNV